MNSEVHPYQQLLHYRLSYILGSNSFISRIARPSPITSKQNDPNTSYIMGVGAFL